jgi:hypothetical protein
MTGPETGPGTGAAPGERGVPQEPVEAAVAALESLKETLQQAGHGEAASTGVQRAVTDYWRDHGDALTTAATAVGEQVRSQMLAELYRWKAQLLQQGIGGSPAPDPAERRPGTSGG